MPEWRAAAGAAVVGNRLYVVGGVAPGGLAQRTFVLDLRTRRWSRIVGPEPREHLAVTALGGRVYALGGRLAGIDTNLRTLQVLDPRTRRWTRLPPIPHARGGTGVAAVGTELVSVGGEEPSGTIASVYAYDTRTRRWRRLPDLPTRATASASRRSAGASTSSPAAPARALRQRRERGADARPA